MHYSHMVRPPITWGVLAPVPLECLVRSSRTVHPLSFGKFLLPLYFRETCFLCTPFTGHFFTWAFYSFFLFGMSFVCWSYTFFIWHDFVVARSVGGTFLEHHWSPSSILQSGRSLFYWTPFSLPLYSGHLFRGTTSLVFLYPYSSLLKLSFGCVSLICPFALDIFSGLLLHHSPLSLLQLIGVIFWMYFFILPTCLGITCLVL